jgi:hypothetical protein
MKAHESSLRIWKAQKSLRSGKGEPLEVLVPVVGRARATCLLEEACTRAYGRTELRVPRDPRSEVVRAALLTVLTGAGFQAQNRSGTGLLAKVTGYSRRHVQRQLALAEVAGLNRYQPPKYSGAPAGPSGHCYGQLSWPGVIARPRKAPSERVTAPSALAPAPAKECAEAEFQRQRAHRATSDDMDAADFALAFALSLKRRPH